MEKSFAKNIVTTDIKFCAFQGGSSLGANVCLSFKDAPYIRIKCEKDRICFSPSPKTENDGCYYTKKVRNQNRFFVPQPILDCYRTKDGQGLKGESVERIIIKDGYAAKANRVKKLNFSDYGIMFNGECHLETESFKEKELFTYNTRKTTLPQFIAKYKKTNYLKVEMYFGKIAGIVITPIDEIPSDIPSKQDLTSWFGAHFQFCCVPYISFWAKPNANIIPSDWFARFTDYESRTFSISVNSHNESILVQMKDACILDKADTYSAEYNSDEKYICHECSETEAISEGELLDIIDKLIEQNEQLESLITELQTQRSALEQKLKVAEAERDMMLDSNKDNAIRSVITDKLFRQKLAHKEACIKEFDEQLAKVNLIPLTEEFNPNN